MKRERFDLPVFLISLAFSVLWGILGNVVYSALYGKIWGPLLVGLFFLGLSLLLFLSMVVSDSLRHGSAYVDISFGKLAAIAGAITLASFLFEIVYEISPPAQEYHEPTGYIFLIDDSGSMSINDQNNTRNSAISSVMESCDKDFPFAVYAFTDSSSRISNVLPAEKAKDITDYGFSSRGSTNVLNAISEVAQDVASGKIDLGESPRILLFSDGISNARGMNKVLSEVLDQGMSISCVGFGDTGSRYLNRIANGGNGVYISIDEISELAPALKEAGSSKTDYSRNLLNYRGFVKNNGLYLVMRLVFMLLLGAGFMFMKVQFFYTRDRHNRAFIILCVLAAAGAVGIEFGTENLVWDESVMRMLLCIGFGLLIGFVELKNGPTVNNGMNGNSGNMNGAQFGYFDAGIGSRQFR